MIDHLASEVDDLAAEFFAAFAHGLVAMARGDYRGARSHLELMVNAPAGLGLLSPVVATLSLCEALAGDFELSERHARHALEGGRHLGGIVTASTAMARARRARPG